MPALRDRGGSRGPALLSLRIINSVNVQLNKRRLLDRLNPRPTSWRISAWFKKFPTHRVYSWGSYPRR